MTKFSEVPGSFTRDSVVLLEATTIESVEQLAILKPEALTEMLNAVIEKQGATLRVKMSEITRTDKSLPTDVMMLSTQLISHAKTVLSRQ